MRLQFLGTGGFHPNDRRHTAGVLLPDLGVAFDAGTSAFRLLPQLTAGDLQIFISHPHLDHVCGLSYLLVPLLDNPARNCQVYAAAGAIEAIDAQLLQPPIFPIKPRLELIPLPAEVEVPGGVVRWWPLHHPGGATGYRLDLERGLSVAYICDTNANDDSIEFLRGVDVLIHECTYPDRLSQWCEPTGHSHTTQVAQLARAAGVGRLILTHVDPQLTEDDPLQIADAQRIFPATVLAEDLWEIDF